MKTVAINVGSILDRAAAEEQRRAEGGDDDANMAPAEQQEPVGNRRTQVVSYERFNQVKQHLLREMRGREISSENGDGSILQKDLVGWYIDAVVIPSGVSDPAQLLAEYKLVRQIISHLINREQTFIVTQEAAPAPDALGDADDEELDPVVVAARERARAIEERVLAINPNIDFDE